MREMQKKSMKLAVWFIRFKERSHLHSKNSTRWSCKFWCRNCRSSVQFSCLVVSNSLRPHGLQHARPPYPSPTPGAYSNSCPLSQWCHSTISSSVVPFSSSLQSFSKSGSFPMSQFLASGGHSIGVSASTSVLQWTFRTDIFRMDWLDLPAVQELSRVFSNTTVQKHQFFGIQLSSQSNFRIHTWPLEKP